MAAVSKKTISLVTILYPEQEPQDDWMFETVMRGGGKMRSMDIRWDERRGRGTLWFYPPLGPVCHGEYNEIATGLANDPLYSISTPLFGTAIVHWGRTIRRECIRIKPEEEVTAEYLERLEEEAEKVIKGRVLTMSDLQKDPWLVFLEPCEDKDQHQRDLIMAQMRFG